MTQAVAVRSQGDDFQARMFWLCAPLLLVPESYVARVSFENGPRAFDDVTVEYVAGKVPQDRYGDEILRDHLQCKWHAAPGQFGHLDLIDLAFSRANGARRWGAAVEDDRHYRLTAVPCSDEHAGDLC